MTTWRGSTFSAPRKALNPFSAKRLASIGKRRETVAAVRKRSGGRCEAQSVWPHTCRGPFDVHELVPRGRGGSPYDESNCVNVCRLAHDHLTVNPEWAASVGLLRSAPAVRGLLYDRRTEG